MCLYFTASVYFICITVKYWVLSLTIVPVVFKQQMVPSTEPIMMWPEEQFGDEKKGMSLQYDHKMPPLSWKRETRLRYPLNAVTNLIMFFHCFTPRCRWLHSCYIDSQFVWKSLWKVWFNRHIKLLLMIILMLIERSGETLFTHRVEAEQTSSQWCYIQLSVGWFKVWGRKHGSTPTVTLPNTLLSLRNTVHMHSGLRAVLSKQTTPATKSWCIINKLAIHIKSNVYIKAWDLSFWFNSIYFHMQLIHIVSVVSFLDVFMCYMSVAVKAF